MLTITPCPTLYSILSSLHYLKVTADYPGFLAPISACDLYFYGHLLLPSAPAIGTSYGLQLGSLCFQDATLTPGHAFSSKPPCVFCFGEYLD